MQNKGLVKVFAILFGLVSIYQLSFTWATSNAEKKAKKYAQERASKENMEDFSTYEKIYLDSIGNEKIFLGETYSEVKNKAINLGLDLKGGINAILQVSVKDILLGLSADSQNTVFREALENATQAQLNSDDTYLNLFYNEFKKIAKENRDIKLSDPTIFQPRSIREKFGVDPTDTKVLSVLQSEVNASISTAFQVLRSRIDKFGVTQPNIQRIGKSGRILIELPGAKDIDRVKNLLQSTAELQFWEVYTNQELSNFFFQANEVASKILEKENEVVEKNKVQQEKESQDEIDALLAETQENKDSIDIKNNLFNYLIPNLEGTSSIIAQSKLADTARVNQLLRNRDVRALLSGEMRYTKFLWASRADKDSDLITLYAIKSNRQDRAPIEGDVISDAQQVFDQFGSNPQVSMSMTSSGTRQWAKMTTENAGKFVAVVLDDYVYTAPRVNEPITGGQTSITGNFTINEAKDLANVLKAGKLPATANIIQSEIIGPSLGQKAINASYISFCIALILVLGWMAFYYGRSGIYANIALAVNILFIFGILSAFGVVLTLPGIAGIILTIGMSVDANVLIFERIKEELRKGISILDAIKAGSKGALSSILDANITTLLTAIILFVFGTGPIKGFAYTLIVGILTSLFTAIFITRLFVNNYAEKGNKIIFATRMTKNWFRNTNINFLNKRKVAYSISISFIILGLISLIINGLNWGVDFVGGRSYTVMFDSKVNPTEIARSLTGVFGDSPEVKTYGSTRQLKITTTYKIDQEGSQVDDQVRELLYKGLKPYFKKSITQEEFYGGYQGQKIGIMSSIKVEASIADDIKTAAQWAILGSIVMMFLYILIRFNKWQFSLAAVASVVHDVLFVIASFSLGYKFLPFDMEIGESFIAAILTVVGYSINDTVVIFDRIREYKKDIAFSKTSYKVQLNKAMSSTLGRTINTSLTTLIVLVAIFIFGGESIRGFMFAMIIGVVAGTYSSLFVATPILFDSTNKKLEKKLK